MASTVLNRPQLIDQRYEVLEHLGVGTFGQAFKVHDRHQDMEVALKLLDPAKVGPWLWAEPTMLTHLQDHYVLRVWNAGIDHGTPYLVTELATHGSLNKGCDHYGWPIADAVRAIRDACRGIHRIHQGGHLHRDIKIENLFVHVDGHIVVGDLGLAAKIGPSGHAPPTGTPATLAPEATAPGGHTSRTSDVFSLGASLYRLLTGFYPTTNLANDEPQLYAMRAAGTMTPLRDLAPHVDAKLAARVKKALAVDPADRFQSAAEFDAALGQLRDPLTRWRRVAPTAPATGELRATRVGKPDVITTITPAKKRFDVVARYNPSGKTIVSVTVAGAALPAELRKIVKKVG